MKMLLKGLVGWEKHPDANKSHRSDYGELAPIKGEVDLSRCTFTLRRPGSSSAVPPSQDMVAMKGYWIKVDAIDRGDGKLNMQVILAPSFHIENNGGFFYANENMKPSEMADNYSDLIATFIEDMRWYTEEMSNGWKEWGSGFLVRPGYPKEKPYIVTLNEAPMTAALKIKDILATALTYLRVR